ncbi:MAG: TonB-dependent receptor domain-containing protein [Rufibacter sp.]
MKRIVLLAAAGIVPCLSLQAQGPATPAAKGPTAPAAIAATPKGNGKIMGVVIDAAAKKPVEFATIALVDKSTGKTVDGTVTDEKGRFQLVRLPEGQYKLLLSFIGFESKTIDNINLDSRSDEHVGTVALVANAKQLQEVAVVGEKDLVEDRVDRLVYNAEKDITNAGGNASEVLKKVPGLTVDLDGNVALRGSNNVRVLINNKPSAIMATSVADALQQIPADMIKSVEVITSPSAKYDAEGTAGIINIVTKKNTLQGVNGTVNATAGNRLTQVNGNVNYRKGRFGLTTTLGRRWGNNPLASVKETDYQGVAGVDHLSQTMNGRREGVFNLFQLGADVELSKKTSLAAGIRAMTADYTYHSAQTSTQYLDQTVTGGNRRDNLTTFSGLNYDLNLDFTTQLAKPGQELSILGLLSRNDRNNDNGAEVFGLDQQLALRELYLNEGFNDEKTIQVDYTHPFKDKQLLEIGAKAIWRSAESDYRFLMARPATAPFEVVPGRTDLFSYEQNVGAVYASYEFKWLSKYQLKLGSRYEYTQVTGDFVSTSTTVKQNYGNFVPSLAISRALKNNQTIKFNYTKRIQRPQLGYLNPYENRSDTFNIQAGNPRLQAEITDSYELGYSTFFKNGVSVTSSFFWRQTDNAIQAYTQATAEGVNYTTYANIGRHASYGTSLFASAKFLKKGSVSGNVTAFYTNLENQTAELRASNASMMYNTNVNASYSFPKGFAAQLYGEFHSRRVTLQGKASAYRGYGLAVRKEILQKNGSISVGVDNPFSPSLKQEITLNTPNARQNSTLTLYNRQVKVSASYKFGKASAKNQPKRRKKISNDDAKSDGDSNEQ